MSCIKNSDDDKHIFDTWAEECLSIDSKVKEADLNNSVTTHFTSVVQNDNTAEDRIAKDLALLLSKLKHPLSSTSSSKVCALRIICCAIRAIGNNDEDDSPTKTQSSTSTNNDNNNRGISLNMMELLGTFLLEHCNPIQSTDIFNQDDVMDLSNNGIDNNDGSTLEDIRDAALTCLCALLQIPCIESSTKSIIFRLETSRHSIERRCVSSDDEYDEYGNNNMMDTDQSDMISGLSMLPRSKRSLCFQSIEMTLKGISYDMKYLSCPNQSNQQDSTINNPSFDSSTKKKISSYATFVASCLHGETDPRCLIQMLHLLKMTSKALSPLLALSTNSSSKWTLSNSNVEFPHLSLFDAVATYYPVQFIPPPNDPYGISRNDIHIALMGVLKSGIYDKNNNDENNMTIHAVRLFLERLAPPSENDPYKYEDEPNEPIYTVSDRLEALEDLTDLLFQISIKALAQGDMQQYNKREHDILSKLSNDVVNEMTTILVQCHESASANAITGEDKDRHDNKELASLCCKFSARMAKAFESYRALQESQPSSNNKKNTKSFWHVFVHDNVKKLSTTISSSPQSLKGKTATAFVASLSSCGGNQTLQLCLDTCIPIFSQILKSVETNMDNSDNWDQERMTSASYGIGAFFSSCRVSLERMKKDGVSICPHPLEKYASHVLNVLCKLVDFGAKEESNIRMELMVGSVKSLESVLQCSPSALFSKEDVETVRTILYILAGEVVSCNEIKSDNNRASNGDNDWMIACTRIVGCAIGWALKSTENINDGTNSDSMSILNSDKDILLFSKDKLVPQVLESSILPSNDTFYALEVLSYACETGHEEACHFFAVKLLQELQSSINDVMTNKSDSNRPIVVAVALGHLLRKGGPMYKAIHSLTYPSIRPIDIIHALTNQHKDQQETQAVFEPGMSNLLLPEQKAMYREKANDAVKLSYSILPYIMPIYNCSLPTKMQNEIISVVSNVLPPLDTNDSVKLCVVLPILSKVLSSNGKKVGESESDTLRSIAPYLTEYSLNMENEKSSRSSAASCLFSIVAEHQGNDSQCLALSLLCKFVSPVMMRAANQFIHKQEVSILNEFMDSIYLAALLGAAAGCRGRHSSKTADEVAKTIVLLACEGSAVSKMLEISAIDCRSDNPTNHHIQELQVMAASALGSVLSVDKGGPFWKQRISHLILPIILSNINIGSSDILNNELNVDIGTLVCACHLMSCISVPALGKQRLNDLAELILRGFVQFLQTEKLLYEAKDSNMKPKMIQDMKSLVLATLLKLMDIPPDVFELPIDHYKIILPSLLVSCIQSDTITDIPSHLMSLQLLMNIAKLPSAEVRSFCKIHKLKVLSALEGSIDNPAVQVRQAAASVRNVWFIL